MSETKVWQDGVSIIGAQDLNRFEQDLDYIGELERRIKNLEGGIDTSIKYDRVWRKRENPDAIFSSPIVSKFLQNDRIVVAHQSMDWRAFVRDFQTGDEMFSRWFSNELYGRAQAADVNGDGLMEFIFSSHAGELRCYNENNELIWEQFDEYTRQGSGTATSGTLTTLVDTNRNWANGTYIANPNVPVENGELEITGGTGAGQWRKLIGSNGDTLTITGEFDVAPDETSTYKIHPTHYSNIMFQHAGTLVEENGVWFLYTCGFDNCCRKINAATGEVLWVYATREQIEPFPLIDDLDNDGVLECYFPSVDWGIYSVNAETGELNWRYETQSGNDSFLNTLDHSSGKRLLVASSRDSRVYLLNADGTLHNRTTVTHGDIDARPVVADFNGDGKLEFVFGGDAGFVYCCNEDGETLWTYRVGVYMNSSAVAADINYDGKLEVLVGDMNGTVHIFNGGTGEKLGQMYFLGSVEGTPAIGDFDGDGLIEYVVTTADGYVEMYRFKR